MKEITIEITKYCKEGCAYCSTDASEVGAHLPVELVLAFLHDNKTATRINISGGEPLSHPGFWQILQACYDITYDVWVYTNAIRQLKFNADVLPGVAVEANVVVRPNEPLMIPTGVKKVHLLKLVPQGRGKDCEQLPLIVVSHNFSYDDNEHDCLHCNHVYLNADGIMVESPCRKHPEADVL